MSVLAVDVGTTGVTALVVGVDGAVLARGYQEFTQHFPQAGWVEHEPEEIWQATLAACRAALDAGAEAPTAVGVTNQRETAVLWDRETLGAARRAIVWQDRRTAGLCEQLRADGHEPRGLPAHRAAPRPLLHRHQAHLGGPHEPRVWAQVEAGRVAVGTVDSYVVARMTRGLHHVTDPSNASRTLLFDLDTGGWSPELCALFQVPIEALPEIVPSWGVVGRTDPTVFLGLDLPIAGIAGDQQSALFGQTCFDPGASASAPTAPGRSSSPTPATTPVRSRAGLLTTVAWGAPDGTLTYALEGSVFVTGAAVQWLRDGLQIIGSAGETEAIARTVPDAGGVVFVPALTGLGAPDWDPDARGLVIGITRGTTRAHLVRATVEAIAFEIRDVVDVMTGEAGVSLPRLAVDGGAAANDLLCELQAAQLGVPVERPEVLETTGLGAAFLAGLGTGVWGSTEELRGTWALDRRFEPVGERDDAAYRRWRAAVERAKGWASV